MIYQDSIRIISYDIYQDIIRTYDIYMDIIRKHNIIRYNRTFSGYMIYQDIIRQII